MTYDVFISYRREGGSFIARNLQQRLERFGLHVFFDMEELNDGKFNERLYEAVERSKNVIFLMTDGALDRCSREDDWVRIELEHAMSHGVNLVPVHPSGTAVSFPEDLPKSLEELTMLEVSELNLEKLFNESVAKIAQRLKNVQLACEGDKEASEAFLSKAKRFKGNDGVIDADEMKELERTARELGISTARRIKLIEQVEQEYVPSSVAELDKPPKDGPTVIRNFDVFISYYRSKDMSEFNRDKKGASVAWKIHERLKGDGYSVSFDEDLLHSESSFNEALLRQIAGCRCFVTLLSKGCFDGVMKGRMRNSRFRVELATAILNKKNIVAVKMPGFTMPAQLPPDIDAVRSSVTTIDFGDVDSFYKSLEERLSASRNGARLPVDSDTAGLFSVDATEKEWDSSLDELFGEDDAFWREEAEFAFKSVSRIIPYAERKRLDDAWRYAEESAKNGDHQAATRYYMEVTSIVHDISGCSSPFVTRLIGDGIDTHSHTWFELALKKAQRGNRDYQYGLGTLYAEGLGVEKSQASAFRWFSRAAKQGHIRAIAAIGAAYASGDGVEVDYRAAKRNLVIAEKSGDMSATERLAYLYENGYGVRCNYAIAVNKYKTAAQNGNSAAMVALGRMLENGVGIDRNPEMAISWYRRAVESGNPVAQRRMAEFLFAGKLVPKDEPEAVKLARLAANQGDADAIAILGRAYEDGTGVPLDQAKAMELYRKAVESGSKLGELYLTETESDDQYRNGVKFLVGNGVDQDFAAARRWFGKSAAQSYVPAMEELGFMNERGLGGEVDVKTAKEWYEKAAEKGSAPAMVGLGKMYYRGYDGIDRDYALAGEYFKKAAALWTAVDSENRWKVLYAFFYLGRIYSEGRGVDQDLQLGQRCFVFGANKGNIVCAKTLGVCYENGTHGAVKSSEHAGLWFSRCAKMLKEGSLSFADDMAMNTVGQLYQRGLGVEKDLEQSRTWFRRAAQLGNVQCLRNLGSAYRSGLGVERDIETALRYYKQAADRGDAEAQNRISWIYYTADLKRDGVARDVGEAFRWASVSAQNGNPGAMETLYRMYRDGEGVERDSAKALEWLEKSAELGCGAAMSALGDCYQRGDLGLAVDFGSAAQWFAKAVEKDDAMGLFCMGMLAKEGNGRAFSLGDALKLLTRAACKDDPDLHYDGKAVQELARMYFSDGEFDAQEERFCKLDPESNKRALYRLTLCYWTGRILDRDDDRAAKCLTACAKRGFDKAQNMLGWAYYIGDKVDRNPQEAFNWTMKAVKSGNPHGMETLFRMYRDGDGVAQSDMEAMKWIEKAVRDPNENGIPSSSLGECYEHGLIGLKKDEKRAFDLYYRASQLGACCGFYNRGRCHLHGIGTPVDDKSGVEWLTKAAETEDLNEGKYDLMAMKLLADNYGRGDLVRQDAAKAQEWRERFEKLKEERVRLIRGYVPPV